MDVTGLLQLHSIKHFHHVLHNFEKPSRRSMQQYIRQYKLENYFPVAYERAQFKFLFILFKNASQFINWYHCVCPDDRNFYSVYLHGPRYLYLDVDVEWNSFVSIEELQSKSYSLIRGFCKILKESIVSWHCEELKCIHLEQFVVFNSSRWQENGTFKASLHIFNPYIIWNDVRYMLKDIRRMKDMLAGSHRMCNTVDSFNFHQIASGIDLSVYKTCQLLRMPGSHKYGMPKSRKKLLFGLPASTALLPQILLNQCDEVGCRAKNWIAFLNVNCNVKSKIKKLLPRLNSDVVKCTEVNFTNSNCHICLASHNCIVHYEFMSKRNDLAWKEERCSSSECRWILYQSPHRIIPYPRCFANLPMSLKQIEGICIALKTFKVTIHDYFNYVFFSKDILFGKHSMVLNFTNLSKNTTAICGHHPKRLTCKRESHPFFWQDGAYTIQCNDCPPHLRMRDISKM